MYEYPIKVFGSHNPTSCIVKGPMHITHESVYNTFDIQARDGTVYPSEILCRYSRTGSYEPSNNRIFDFGNQDFIFSTEPK